MEGSILMRHHFAALGAAMLVVGAFAQAASAQDVRTASVLFENVRIFNGASERLSSASNVLVVGNTIQQISTAPIEIAPGTAVQRIKGDGLTLMPGLIDAHTHMMMADTPFGALMTSDPNYLTLNAGRGATATLMRGFTSVRDVGGPSFGLKRAID
jgi:imidazolonepropionase-like amidohydrolase